MRHSVEGTIPHRQWRTCCSHGITSGSHGRQAPLLPPPNADLISKERRGPRFRAPFCSASSLAIWHGGKGRKKRDSMMYKVVGADCDRHGAHYCSSRRCRPCIPNRGGSSSKGNPGHHRWLCGLTSTTCCNFHHRCPGYSQGYLGPAYIILYYYYYMILYIIYMLEALCAGYRRF